MSLALLPATTAYTYNRCTEHSPASRLRECLCVKAASEWEFFIL